MVRTLAHTLLAGLLAAPALAQCEPGWVGESLAAPKDSYATLVLPDGDLLVAGQIHAVNGVATLGVARRESATGEWSTLGESFDGTVNTLALMPNGDIVAGGHFERVDGVAANSIARWDGVAWHALGSGVGLVPANIGSVNALAPLPSGDLLVGGMFDVAGGVPVTSIARWDGVAWHSIDAVLEGSELARNVVYAMLPLANGGVIVAGSFYSVNGVEARSIARWDGSRWSAMGFGLGTGVQSLAQMDDGSIVASGGFFVPIPGGHLARVARWSGDAWEPIGPGVNGAIESMAVRPNGEIIIGGQFGPGPYTTANRVARWNGSAWVGLGTGIAGRLPRVRSIAALPNGDVVVGGKFDTAGGIDSPGLATYSFGGNCCPADLDNDGDFGNGLTRDDAVTIEDLLSFLVGFESGNVLVDLDNGTNTGTPDNAVDINDLLFFLARFEAGC